MSFPMVALGEILTKSDEWIDINPIEKYQQVTVRLWEKGVMLHDDVSGAEIAASKRLVVHPQQFIVSRIEELAAKIEEAQGLRKKAGKELDALAHSTLRYILETNANNPEWEFGNIPQFAEVNPSRRGKTDFSPSMPVSFIPMAAVDDITGRIVRATIRPFAEVSKGYSWFNDGDIIFARITPCMQNGKVAIAEGLANSIGFGSTEFHVLRPGPKIIGRWLYILMRHKDFKKDAETSAELDALLPAVLDKAFKGEM